MQYCKFDVMCPHLEPNASSDVNPSTARGQTQQARLSRLCETAHCNQHTHTRTLSQGAAACPSDGLNLLRFSFSGCLRLQPGSLGQVCMVPDPCIAGCRDVCHAAQHMFRRISCERWPHGSNLAGAEHPGLQHVSAAATAPGTAQPGAGVPAQLQLQPESSSCQ